MYVYTNSYFSETNLFMDILLNDTVYNYCAHRDAPQDVGLNLT